MENSTKGLPPPRLVGKKILSAKNYLHVMKPILYGQFPIIGPAGNPPSPPPPIKKLQIEFIYM